MSRLPENIARKSIRLCRINTFRAAFWCCFAALLLIGFPASAETVPSGAILEVRLQQPISSYSTRTGTKISAILVAPISVAGRVVLPLGTLIEGSVVSVRKVGLGVVHETAEIDLEFDRLVLPNGSTIPLKCRMTQVENARESINKRGHIQGIRSTSTMSHRASGVVGTLAFGDPIAAIFTTAGSSSVLRFSEPEISFPVGTEMIAELTAPLVLPTEAINTVPPIATSQDGKKELRQLVRKLPFRTYTNGSNVPSDLTNLIFIGSQGAMERAFAASGWEPVDDLTAQTTYRTVRSIAENQGYRRAPMSTLLLESAKPEYAYAKTLNTFSKRHHLRIWSRSETWQGEPVWTSSSTHDIGIGFSKKNKTFIHLIDTHIDNERAKVVNDMVLTGCVSGVQLVKRPWVPKDAKNGTNEALITDGTIAVLQFNKCDAPAEEPPDEAVAALRVHGNALDRSTRQTVLTLKNNILRDNVGVMAYSGIRYAVAARKKGEGPPSMREIAAGGNEYSIEHGFQADDSYEAPSNSNEASNASGAVRKKERRARSWAPPSVELGIHAGWLGYAGGNGGAIGYIIQPTNPPGGSLLLGLGNSFDGGWNIGGTITLDSQKYFSHEFSYDHSFTTFNLGLAVVDNELTSSAFDSQFAFADTGLQTSQFAYNLLIDGRPKTSRWRPYLAIGPSLQLMHLSDAPIKKAPNYFKLGLSNIGLISAAYSFGGTPPLEGGGIFQFGLNYGGGIRYRVTPRWMVRVDYRETLTSQPDFWSKSKKDILAGIDVGDYSVTEIGPVLDGLMRQQHATAGISFTF